MCKRTPRMIVLLAVLLLAAPTTVLAAPALSIDPASAPAGQPTTFRIIGTGFDPATAYELRLVDARGTVVLSFGVTADSSGRFTDSIGADGSEPPGQYTLHATRQGGVVASAVVTLLSM